MTRIYKVAMRQTPDAVRYVRAENAAQALRRVAGELYTVEVASTEDVVAAVKAGTFLLMEPDAAAADEPAASERRAAGRAA